MVVGNAIILGVWVGGGSTLAPSPWAWGSFSAETTLDCLLFPASWYSRRMICILRQGEVCGSSHAFSG